MRCSFLLMTWALLLPASVLAASGVQGRIAWRGELVPGITVRAYRSIEAISAGEPVAVSRPSELDGTYSLDLPPGRYFLTASDFEGAPEAGDYFCYYSGSPVRVAAGHRATVGFNMIRVPEEEKGIESGYSGLKGKLSFQGEPLEKAYVYVYRDPSRGFKGPGYFIQPVARGDFTLRLPPGEYYLLARKRVRGGQFGPIEIGDYFNYYYGNPIRVEENRVDEVKLETITRMPMLEEGEQMPFRGIRGVIRDGQGRPAEGIHVFAYTRSGMTGTPEFFSAPTGRDGTFELALPGNGPYYLLARENFGGPAAEGERYGKFNGRSDHAVRLEGDATVQDIEINVEAHTAQ